MVHARNKVQKPLTSKKEKRHPGLFAGALAAGALAGYLFYGSSGAKNRKKLRGWMLRAKADVLDRVERTRGITQDTYEELVNTVMGKYKKMKRVNDDEAEALARELKRYWRTVKRELSASAREVKKTVRKAVREFKTEAARQKRR